MWLLDEKEDGKIGIRGRRDRGWEGRKGGVRKNGINQLRISLFLDPTIPSPIPTIPISPFSNIYLAILFPLCY